MADNELAVVAADGSTKNTRSVDRRGTHHQVALIGEMPDLLPALTGATVVYTVTSAAVTPLDPPDAGADYCRLRAWQTAKDGKRLFFRKDGVSPANDGTNAEGYMLDLEGMTVKIATLTNFKMIVEAGGGNFTVTAEWLLTTP